MLTFFLNIHTLFTKHFYDPLSGSTQTVLQNIPSLPTKYILALKPWFSKETLQQGHNILSKEDVTFFIFQRRFAGILINATDTVSLQMGKNKGSLPFVFRDGDCSKCGWQQGGGK
jgi:hypothetical protein